MTVIPGRANQGEVAKDSRVSSSHSCALICFSSPSTARLFRTLPSFSSASASASASASSSSSSSISSSSFTVNMLLNTPAPEAPSSIESLSPTPPFPNNPTSASPFPSSSSSPSPPSPFPASFPRKDNTNNTQFKALVSSIAGEGFTFWEVTIPSLVVVFSLVFLSSFLIPEHPEWSLIQRFWAYFFALNTAFGTAVSTRSLKRSYQTSPKGGIRGRSLMFVYLDGIGQTFLLNYIFLDQLGGEWVFAAMIGAYLFLTFALYAAAPLYLVRVVEAALLMVLIFLATYVFPQVPGLEWYPYVIFVKYLNHLEPL